MLARRYAAGLSLAACLLIYGCSTGQQLQTGANITPARVIPPPVVPGLQELQKPPNLLLERPQRDPFIKVEFGGSSMPSETGKAAPAAAYLLSAILVGGGKSSAVLSTGSRTVIVHPGDMIGGYKVVSITDESVVLVKGRQRQELSLPKKQK